MLGLDRFHNSQLPININISSQKPRLEKTLFPVPFTQKIILHYFCVIIGIHECLYLHIDYNQWMIQKYYSHYFIRTSNSKKLCRYLSPSKHQTLYIFFELCKHYTVKNCQKISCVFFLSLRGVFSLENSCDAPSHKQIYESRLKKKSARFLSRLEEKITICKSLLRDNHWVIVGDFLTGDFVMF